MGAVGFSALQRAEIAEMRIDAVQSSELEKAEAIQRRKQRFDFEISAISAR